ncbi:MAG: Kelch repeat-containing protein [Blastocatellia bacterium]
MTTHSRFGRRIFTIHRLIACCGLALILVLTLLQQATPRGHAASSKRQTLTFEDRVAAQRAIEAVYHRHRIWPKDNPGPKPSLDEAMPEAVLRAKVEDYLRQSNALEIYWQRPITGEQLQAEIERMQSRTKQPEALRELWAALGDDPLVIAECLARPALAERSSREWYAPDERFHGALKQQAGLALDQSRTGGQPFDQWWNEARHGLSLDVQPTAFVFRLPQSAAVPGQCAGEAWTATSTSGAPATRNGHAAVWTGSEMIVWGGLDGVSFFNSGGRYNPALDAWTPTSTINAPTARAGPTAIWTGNEMIVWGGNSSNNVTFSTGGRYNPAANSWQPTSNTGAPSSRALGHTAVWTGSEMIIWGGLSLSPLTSLTTGGRYNPGSDSWMPTTTTNVPGTRIFHTAVWTGAEMIIWGGFTASGGRYNPASNLWTATSLTDAPATRSSHSAVWAGNRMIIWGGSDRDTGGQYDPATNSWTATSTTNSPAPRRDHTAVWTGNEMIVWGGQVGTSPNSTEFNSGGRYDPAANTWTATSTTNAPSARYSQIAVWTGNQMIVWGGLVGSASVTRLNTGGRYTVAGALTISPASQSFPAGGGNGNVSVFASGSCSWTAASNANWITITSGGSGSGNGTVAFAVGANTGISPRTGTITITGQTFTVNQAGNDCHTVTGINPTSGGVGSSVTITGTNFTGVSAIRFANNVPAQFTAGSATSITATVPAGAVTGPITLGKTNCPDAQTGVFTVLNPAPMLTSLSPSSVVAGGATFTLVLTGANFITGSVVRWNGGERATTFVSSTQLNATITASDIASAGASSITVFNPAPGGGESGAVSLTIRQPNKPSQVTGVTPNPVIAGGQSFTLTVNGSDFVSGSTLRWDGNDRPTTFVSTTRLTAAIPATDIATAREVKITVFTPDGGGVSNQVILTIANAVTSVPAGSFTGTTIAPDSIVAAFGTKLATAVKIATTTPLPTELEGTTVKVTDSMGAERLARLFFVAPTQINYLMPAETAAGAATITVKSGDGIISVGTALISLATPSLFTANANGQGVAAGVALRVKADGTQVYEPITRFDSTQNRFVPEPIDLSNANEQVFLVLYGSGIRYRSSLSAVTATIGGLNHPVLFAGAVEGLAGLDQINVGPLSRSLTGRGEVDVVLTVDGKPANLARVSFK